VYAKPGLQLMCCNYSTDVVIFVCVCVHACKYFGVFCVFSCVCVRMHRFLEKNQARLFENKYIAAPEVYTRRVESAAEEK
jgi:hypothetical protein